MQYMFTLVKKDYSQRSLMHGAQVKATIFISIVSGSVYLNMTFHIKVCHCDGESKIFGVC